MPKSVRVSNEQQERKIMKEMALDWEEVWGGQAMKDLKSDH